MKKQKPTPIKWQAIGSYNPPYKPQRGSLAVFTVTRHHWAGKKNDKWPATDVIEPATGAVYTLRIDKAYLRAITCIPVGESFRLEYHGKGKKVGKKNPADLYTISIKAGESLGAIGWHEQNPPKPEKVAKRKSRNNTGHNERYEHLA